MALEHYGLIHSTATDQLQIEFAMIKAGGKWVGKDGQTYGLGLFEHYKRAQILMWPSDYHHRWSDLQLQEILSNTMTVVLGPKDTGKTKVCLARFALTDYFCFPDNTLIICSSTTLAALETRVWGEIKSMFASAKDQYDWLPGVVLESKHAIVTDDLTDECVISRDMRKGILCVACKTSGGSFTGISSYVGMKQQRRRHLGDEFQFMSPAMMDSIANMNSGDYKGVFVGNPIGQNDPLDQLSEPECGWDSHPEPEKTTVWKNRRFLNSRTICLYGPDSPTFDFPDGAQRYRGLINADSIARVVAGYGKDSHQYYSQCLGVRKVGLTARRVITKQLCRTMGAFDSIVWDGTPTTKVAGLDAAYGGVGGDRCVGGHAEFGTTVEGKVGILLHPPQIVPVSARNPSVSPEDQIALWQKNYCENHGIPPENFGYDSTGRGTMGNAFSRNWSVHTEAIEFGGSPTNRPVSLDMYIYDPVTRQRRLKTCKEHYSKFVTELCFTVRYAIESRQLRGLTEQVADEGCQREWKEVAGGRIEVESKVDMKQRIGFSCDLFDWAAIVLEMARRRGFVISKLGSSEALETNNDWIWELIDKQRAIRKRYSLNYAA